MVSTLVQRSRRNRSQLPRCRHGHKLVYNEKVIVYHRARETLFGFIKQSFWYGFGRKELTIKHGDLWSAYDPVEMVQVKKENQSGNSPALGSLFSDTCSVNSSEKKPQPKNDSEHQRK